MADISLKRIAELDKERAALLETAKSDALSRINAGIADLKALGLNYALIQPGTRKGAGKKVRSRNGTGYISDAECPVCKFKTSPPHDARRHRLQGKRKKPFTAPQLKEMGYARV